MNDHSVKPINTEALFGMLQKYLPADAPTAG
jgi:hypothetical protein